MSAILNLCDSVLLQARRFQQAGQASQAIDKLSYLLQLPDLPAESAAEAHTRLGELYLKRRRFRKSRRHLRAALALAPDTARLHHRIAQTYNSGPDGNAERARRHYRRAFDLEPQRPRWRAEAGLLAIRNGDVDDGLALLRQAHQHAPEDAGVLGKLVKGLCLAGRSEVALRVVRLARFSAPRCERTRNLESDLLLARLRREQEQTKATRQVEERAVLLPFVRPELPATNSGRYDGPHKLAGPHLVRMPVRVGRRSS